MGKPSIHSPSSCPGRGWSEEKVFSLWVRGVGYLTGIGRLDTMRCFLRVL